jgi:hypothetical protein
MTSDAPEESAAELDRIIPEHVMSSLGCLRSVSSYMLFSRFTHVCSIHQLKFQFQPAVIGISAIPAAAVHLLMPVASKTWKSEAELPKGDVNTRKKPPARCQHQRRRESGIFRSSFRICILDVEAQATGARAAGVHNT